MNAYMQLHEGRQDRLQRALSSTAGLHLDDGYRGRLKCGRHQARVLFESGEWVRVSLHVENGCTAREALEANRFLAGNVRFGGSSPEPVVLADTRLDGTAHLPQSFAEIRDSVHRATARRLGACEEKGSIDPKTIEAALERLGWGKESVVKLEGQWEIRPPSSDLALPLRVSPEGAHVCIRRTIVKSMPDGDRARALSEQAMRFNGELRLARLALLGGELVAESRLHGGQVDSGWIALAARAVVAAFDHCHRRLKILSEDARVARCYVRLFCELIS